MGHGRAERVGNASDFLTHCIVIQTQVLSPSQEDIIGLAVIDALEQARSELHQASCLSKALVLLEQSNQMLEGGVERVGFPYLLGDLFQACRHNVSTISCCLDTLSIFLGYIIDDGLVGQFQNQPLLQDLVDLVTSQLDGGNGAGLATGFLLEVRDCFGNCLCLSNITSR